MTDWQPIDTAPKDGSVLVFGLPSDLIINNDKLLSFSSPVITTAYWDDIDDSFVLTGGTWLGPFIEPTHWMPLPTPPESD